MQAEDAPQRTNFTANASGASSAIGPEAKAWPCGGLSVAQTMPMTPNLAVGLLLSPARGEPLSSAADDHAPGGARARDPRRPRRRACVARQSDSAWRRGTMLAVAA